MLKCISQLEMAQHIGTNKREHQADLKHAFQIDDKSLSTLQECLVDASSQSVAAAVDRCVEAKIDCRRRGRECKNTILCVNFRIFQGSSKLSGEAIVHFVRALCRVSHEELAIPGRPRHVMLQKIVEISFYNMERIRIEVMNSHRPKAKKRQ